MILNSIEHGRLCRAHSVHDLSVVLLDLGVHCNHGFSHVIETDGDRSGVGLDGVGNHRDQRLQCGSCGVGLHFHFALQLSSECLELGAIKNIFFPEWVLWIYLAQTDCILQHYLAQFT